jgi:hypothetical protein
VLGGVGPLSAHILWRISYDDGSSEILPGHSVHTVEGIRPAGVTKRSEDVRPDLQPAMEAIKILTERIEAACMDLDEPKPKKSRRTR